MAVGTQTKPLSVVRWITNGHRKVSQTHIRFDYAVRDGVGTVCGLQVPGDAFEHPADVDEVTCCKCKAGWN